MVSLTYGMITDMEDSFVYVDVEFDSRGAAPCTAGFHKDIFTECGIEPTIGEFVTILDSDDKIIVEVV